MNNDLAFMIEDMGARYLYPDHKHVDDVLAFRTRPVVYPEIQRDLCPSLFTETVPATADRDIYACGNLPGRTLCDCRARPPKRLGTPSRGRFVGTPRTRRTRSSAGTGDAQRRTGVRGRWRPQTRVKAPETSGGVRPTRSHTPTR